MFINLTLRKKVAQYLNILVIVRSFYIQYSIRILLFTFTAYGENVFKNYFSKTF